MMMMMLIMTPKEEGIVVFWRDWCHSSSPSSSHAPLPPNLVNNSCFCCSSLLLLFSAMFSLAKLLYLLSAALMLWKTALQIYLRRKWGLSDVILLSAALPLRQNNPTQSLSHFSIRTCRACILYRAFSFQLRVLCKMIFNAIALKFLFFPSLLAWVARWLWDIRLPFPWLHSRLYFWSELFTTSSFILSYHFVITEAARSYVSQESVASPGNWLPWQPLLKRSPLRNVKGVLGALLRNRY